MKLPKHLITKLSLAMVAACEPAHPDIATPIDQPLVDETSLDVHITSQDEAPAAAPRFASPTPSASPQPSPPPKLKPKAKPKKIWASICGGPPQLVNPEDAMVDCGMG